MTEKNQERGILSAIFELMNWL